MFIIANIISTLGSSVYIPGYLEVARQFNVSSTVAILPFTTYVLGLSFGPVLGAPISETRGRRVVFLVCTPIYAVFVIGCGFSNNFASLVILRFLAGMFGAPPLAVGAGSVADLSTAANRAPFLGIVALIGFLGPVLG
jgi:MFS family permease